MNKKNFGFTLIELIVVIAILGILATGTMAIINPFGQIQKSRDAIRKSALRQIANELDAYFITYGSYPSTGNAVWAEGKCTNFPETTIKPNYSGPNAYIPNLAPLQIKNLPGDPNVNGIGKRCYIYQSDGTYYILSAHVGAEASFQPNDPLIRLLAPACTTQQATFTILSRGGTCW
ncbi:MAG: type II secretion system protein [Candidatus Levyibacteriota bacterium]